MSDAELISMLCKAKSYLSEEDDARFMRSKKSERTAAICLLESLGKESATFIQKKQRIRSESAFKSIFAQAGLITISESPPTIVHLNYLPVKIWVLA